MKKIGIGQEGKMHKDFANIIKQYEGYKQLNCIRWSYDASGERRTAITGALLKAKGLKGGKPDYEFIGKGYINKIPVACYLYLEFKFGKGKQSENQKEFQKSIKGLNNVAYYVVYTIEEAIKILIDHGIIKK